MTENPHRPNLFTYEASALSLNEQLAVEYRQRLQSIYEIIDSNKTTDQQTSWPFLMHVSNEYVIAPKRLLFVGQETYGWNNDLPRPSVDQAMDFYDQVSNQDKFHNSPFWWFRKLTAERFSVPINYAKASLWTNLSKIDVNKKRPTGKLFDNTMQLFIDLLKQEIDITKPDIVLILNTNGDYNWHIHQYFSQKKGWHKELLESGVHKLHSTILPTNTFQISHPNSLRYKKGSFADKANAIIDILEKSLI